MTTHVTSLHLHHLFTGPMGLQRLSTHEHTPLLTKEDILEKGISAMPNETNQQANKL